MSHHLDMNISPYDKILLVLNNTGQATITSKEGKSNLSEVREIKCDNDNPF
jgi:hypothetical protein